VAAYHLLDDNSQFYQAIYRAAPFPLVSGIRSPEMTHFFAETFIEGIIRKPDSTCRTPREIIDESFDKILGIRSNSHLVRRWRRLMVQLRMETSLSRRGMRIQLGVVMVATVIIIGLVSFPVLLAEQGQVEGFVNLALVLCTIVMVVTTYIFVGAIQGDNGRSRVRLWAALFLLTNRKNLLMNNHIFTKITTERIAVYASGLLNEKPQPIGAAGRQTDGP
jgi:hypothetical protein